MCQFHLWLMLAKLKKLLATLMPTHSLVLKMMALPILMKNRSDGIVEPDEHNQMTNQESDGSVESDGHDQMANEVDGGVQPDEQTQIDNDSKVPEPYLEVQWNGGTNMEKGLERISRARRGKLLVVILEGEIRPEVPLFAAKFATKCNIAARNHVPVFKRWKDYKNQLGIFKNFIGKVGEST